MTPIESDRAPGRERPTTPAPIARIIDMKQAMIDADGPLPWRVKPFAMDGSVTLLLGRRGEHKSWLSMFACAAVAGADVDDALSAQPGAALYIDAENGRRRMGRRFTLAGFDSHAFTVANGQGLHLPHDIGQVKALVDHTNAKLVVLDSLRRLAPGMREKESDDTAPIMAALSEMAQQRDIAVVVIHHRSSKPGAPDSRGSSALEDQIDLAWVIEKVAGDPQHATRRRMRNIKMRDDADYQSQWLSFKTVAGFMTIATAEAFGGAGDDAGGEEPINMDEVIAERIRSLAGQVRTDEEKGWTPSRLAAAVGSKQSSGTFQRALDIVLADGWCANGSGKARRIFPNEPRQPRLPLGDGTVGVVDEEGET
jgi:hypothetical protein